MSSRNYSSYSFTDFLEDDFFISWVIVPDEESNLFWESFLLQHPDREGIIRQASSFIRAYRQQEFFPNLQSKDVLWRRIGTTIEHQKDVHPIIPISFYRKMAAAVALIVTTGAILWLFAGRQYTVQTEYGEVKTITLPDHSVVTLNGNSSLKYVKDWDSLTVREVWLEGEAYFNVAHLNKDTTDIPQGHRFIVHSDAVNLEVLGTTFNVAHRNDHTNITLLSGKVRVQPEEDAHSKSSQGLIMSPGDQVEYVKKNLIEKRRVEKIKTVTAWINHEFAFVNPHLKDIVNALRNDYGYEIEISEELMALPIEGDISVSGIPELLSTIEAILGLHVESTDKHLLITRK